MSLKVLCSEYLFSNNMGLGVRRSWLMRKVAESFLGSTNDGEIKVSPDPVTMIDGDLYWFNDQPDPQDIFVMVERAPRQIVAQSPCTVIILEATTSQIGVSPLADYPSVLNDAVGGRMAIDRMSVSADDLQYGRFFLQGEGGHSYEYVGTVPSGQAFHFRYLAAVQTPGVWTEPTQFTARWEADAQWARLIGMACPVDVASALVPTTEGVGSVGASSWVLVINVLADADQVVTASASGTAVRGALANAAQTVTAAAAASAKGAFKMSAAKTVTASAVATLNWA